MKVKAPGLEIKQVLVGLHKFQISELDRLCLKHNRARSEIIREAISLWLRGYELRNPQESSE